MKVVLSPSHRQMWLGCGRWPEIRSHGGCDFDAPRLRDSCLLLKGRRLGLDRSCVGLAPSLRPGDLFYMHGVRMYYKRTTSAGFEPTPTKSLYGVKQHSTSNNAR